MIPKTLTHLVILGSGAAAPAGGMTVRATKTAKQAPNKPNLRNEIPSFLNPAFWKPGSIEAAREYRNNSQQRSIAAHRPPAQGSRLA